MDGGGVAVLFTTPKRTLAALRAAAQSVLRNAAPVRLIVTLPVPYPLPPSSPPVPLQFTKWQVRQLVTEASVDANVELRLCRDRREALRQCLKPGSLVVLGGQRHWWRRNPEQKLVRWLQRSGHSVVLAAPEESENRSTDRYGLKEIQLPNSSH